MAIDPSSSQEPPLPPPPPLSPPVTSETAEPSNQRKWQLPTGIEDHIESGIIKLTAGILVGGTLGMLLFRSGKGWRSASMAAGAGVALGSTYVRFASASRSSISTAPTTQTTTARIQTFDTKPVPQVGTAAPRS
jgi:Domain of unknown function (DUF543)